MFGRATILFPLAVLGLLALVTFWIDRTVQPPVIKPDGSKRHDPDYVLNNFNTVKTGINGSVQYILAATEMTHFPDDDSTKLERPHLTQYSSDKPYTQIESQRGTVSSNGEIIEFMDNVKVLRQGYQERGDMTVTTEYLKVFPKTEIATSDKPVVIKQSPSTELRGTGMIYNKKEKTLKLLKNVHVHYLRPGLADKATADKTGIEANQNNKVAVTKKTVAKPPVKQAGSKSSTNKAKSSNNSNAQNNQAAPAQNKPRIRRQYEQATP
jgi:lipopolysaccharide export system protein LptC